MIRSILNFYIIIFFTVSAFGNAETIHESRMNYCQEMVKKIEKEFYKTYRGNLQSIAKIVSKNSKKDLIDYCLQSQIEISYPILAKKFSDSTQEKMRKLQSTLAFFIITVTILGTAFTIQKIDSYFKNSGSSFIIALFTAQLSTFGITSIGAPLWDPLTSDFRQWAFGLGDDEAKAETHDEENENFEELWRDAYAAYSLNAQLGRDNLNQALINYENRLYLAKKWLSEDPDQASEIIAYAAYYTRRTFAEIEPDNYWMQQSFKLYILQGLKIPPKDFKNKIHEKLKKIDPDSKTNLNIQRYYSILLDTWFS